MSAVSQIRILMIVKEPQEFESQLKFLNRRGWTVACVESLREGIEYIVGNQPDFVLISVNHPNPKVAKMPTIISQTFNCRSILIGEDLDSQTAAALSRSGLRDVIHAPVSGPGIQLRIKQILAREEQETSAAEQEISDRKKMRSAKEDVRKAMKGVNTASMKFSGSSEPQIQAPSVAAQVAQRANQKQVKPQGPAPAMIQQSGKSHAGPAYDPYKKGAVDPANKFANLPPLKPQASEIDFTASGSDISDGPSPKKKAEPLDGYAEEESELPAHLEPTLPQVHTSAKDSGSKNRPRVTDSAPKESQDPIAQEAPALDYSKPSKNKPTNEDAIANNKDDLTSAENRDVKPESVATPAASDSAMEEEGTKPHQQESVEPEAESKAKGVPADEHEVAFLDVPSKVLGPRSLSKKTDFAKNIDTNDFSGNELITILKIIREAFEDSVGLAEEMNVDDERIYFDGYNVNVEGHSGFLLYSSKKKSAIESHLVPKINTRIIEGLKQAGFSMEKMNNIDIGSLEKLHLTIDGVFENSVLSMISGGRDEEIVMSYLDANLGHDLIEDKEMGMIGFPVESIPPDVKSPFKVFLYLPVNKKYYLYLNDGNSFSAKQLEKLGTKGVSHLHCKSDDRSSLNRFFMSRKLYDKFKKSS